MVRLEKKTLSMILWITLACFIFEGAPCASRTVLAAGNIRPVSTEKSARLSNVQNDLDVAFEKVTKTERIAGALPDALNSEDAFKKFLGDYKASDAIDDLAYGTFVKKEIDLASSAQARDALATYFGPIKSGDKFYTLTYLGFSIALVKKDASGVRKVKAIVEDVTALPLSIFARDFEHVQQDAADMKANGVTTVDVIANDYLELEKRSAVALPDRMII